MTRHRTLHRSLALAVALMIPVMVRGLAVSAAHKDDYQIIVNPNNPIVAIDRQFLRDAYLRKATDWSNGGSIRPVDLRHGFAVRERFIHEVLHKSPSQLKSYWNQLLFSGKGVPPPEVDSTDAVIRYVLANAGAVGYLPADADPRAAKRVTVR
jgi:ABC-type phosphate transport system substrate-binding protein